MNSTFIKLTIVFGMSFQLLANATNWDTLIEQAPKVEHEVINLDPRYVSLRVIKLPGGGIRFNGFVNIANHFRPRLTIESEDSADFKNTESFCRYALGNKKKFKAKLYYALDPLKKISNEFALKDGRKFNLDSFENKYQLGSANISFEKAVLSWSTYEVGYAKKESFQSQILTLLNQSQPNSEGDVTLDLSAYNGFACDLATGGVILRIARTLEYEAPLPKLQPWIDSREFANTYRVYWKEHARLNLKDDQPINAASAILMGIVLSENISKDKLLTSEKRLSNLASAISMGVSSLVAGPRDQTEDTDVFKNWKATFEFSKPLDLIIQEELVVGRDAVFAEFKKE